MSAALAELVADIATRFDDAVLLPLIARLEREDCLDALQAAHPRALAERSNALRRVCRAESAQPRSVALALRTAIASARRAAAERVSLVWTGPKSHPTSGRVRRLDQALYEVVERAESALLLVTFAAWPFEPLFDALRSATTRGVEVRIVLETAEASGGALSNDTVEEWRSALPQARYSSWRAGRRGSEAGSSSGVMHGKAAVADRQLALVSSANLTGRALSSNLELGILVDGGEIPGRIVDYIDELAEANIIVQC